MNKSKISIIVPVFNAQDRLAKCINSLIQQKYSNIEIILVNDGSTDDSLTICREFEDKDKRIILINQKSSGVSSARNAGLDKATGEYIMFVDSDDFVGSAFCQDALENVSKFNADIGIFGFERIENGTSTNSLFYGNKSRVLPKELVMEKAMMDGYTWDKIYRRTLFNGIHYPINKNYEDLSTTYRLLNKAEKVSYCAEVNYYYVASENSIVTNMSQKNIADQFNAAWEFMEFLKSNYSGVYKKNMSQMIVYAIRYCTYCSKRFNSEYYKRASNIIKKEPVPSNFDMSHRVIMKLFKVSAPLSKALMILRRKTNQ